MDLVRSVLETPAARDVLATLAVALVVFLLRRAVARSVQATSLPLEIRRRWNVLTRNLAIALFLVGAGVIWADELRTVALSLVAFGAAIVLATKELIACFAGAVLRTTAGGFALGDRIEIDGVRGDVIDVGALTTTVVEVGPGPAIHQATGRIVVVPNSMFLLKSFANETFASGHVFHTVSLPLGREEDWAAAEQCLLSAAREESAPHHADAEAALIAAASKRGAATPDTQVRTWVRIVDAERLELTVRFVAPARLRGTMEQAILRRFLATQSRPSTGAPAGGGP